MHPRPACLPEAIWDALSLGVRDFVHKCGLEKAIVALSGGMDSALVLCVAVEALGAEVYSSVVIPRPHPDLKKITDCYRLENLLPY